MDEDSSIQAPDPNLFPPDPEKFRGQCVSCGFAAKVNANDVLPEDPSITWHERVMGRIAAQTKGPETTQFYLWCFRQAARLRVEESSYGTYKTLNRKRACPKWTAYEPGVSPKEQLDQTFEQEIKRLEAKIQADALQTTKEARDWTRWGTILALILVFLGVVTAVFGALGYFAPRPAPINVHVSISAPTPTQ
jgi:hypothetical protein